MKKLFIGLLALLAPLSYGAVSERDLSQIAAPYNYLTNGGCESSITGFSKFNTTFSGGLPTTITAGSSKLGLLATTSNILQGNASCQMNVTTASGATGHGIISDPITIKDSDLGRVLAAAFSYNFVAGNANVDVSGTSTQTLQVWIYNVGLGTWYQPAGYNSINTNGTSAQLVPGQTPDITFQSNISNSSNNNQYRVALIIANDPAGTFKFNFDNMSFGPTKKAYGPAITNWASFNPTGTFNTNTTYFGQWRRVGDSLEVQFTMTFSGPPNAVTQTTVDIPFGLQVDVSKIPISGGSEILPIGRNVLEGSSGQGFSGSIVYLAPTQTLIYSNFLAGSQVQDGGTTNTFPFALDVNTSITGYFRVPIVGWSSQSVMSSDTDTRIVAFSAAMAGSPTIISPNGILWDTILYDTHGAYDPATSFYRIPVSGYYRIFLSEADSATTNNGLILANGTNIAQGQQHILAGEPGLTAITYKLNAGDVIYASISNNGTLTNGVTLNFMTIERVSGPSVIAASETVAASYGQGVAQVIGGGGTQTQLTSWQVKYVDTHNAFEPAGGVYTVPVSGIYRIYFQSQFSSVASGAFTSQIFKTVGGSFTLLGYGMRNPPSSQDTIPVSVISSLNAGDFISFDVMQTTGSNQSINADPSAVQFSLERIGH